MFDFNGKNVVVVGGFGTLGHQISRILAQKFINTLIIADRLENSEMLKQLQAEAGTTKVVSVHTDLTDRASIEHAVRQIAGVVKHIDVLINTAAILCEKDVEATIDVNLTGPIQIILALLPLMDKTQAGNGGIVMNISSVFGLEPAAGVPVFAAAKHGIVGFTRSLADQRIHAKTGVAFITVNPGLIADETIMHLRENIILEQHNEEFLDAIAKAKKQTPQEVAVNVVKAVELSKNGAVYLATAGQLKEINPAVYWQWN